MIKIQLTAWEWHMMPDPLRQLIASGQTGAWEAGAITAAQWAARDQVQVSIPVDDRTAVEFWLQYTGPAVL